MRRRLVVGATAALGIVCACQWIAGINDRSVYDAGGDAGNTDANPCIGSGFPPNPGPNTSSPSDSVTVTLALSQVMLGQTDGGPYYGFNLDNTCTCPGPASCSINMGQPACDDPGGIDNYARRIFETINEFSPDGGFITEAKLNNALLTGTSGALIQVSQYNGKPDDGEVTVTVYGSLGYENYPTPPAFDGGDYWKVDTLSQSGLYSTMNAYVAKYTLVAALNFPIIVGSTITQPVYIQLESGDIEAVMQPDDAGGIAKMTGVLGGRWEPSKFLSSLAVVPDPISPGSYLCGGDGTYGLLKTIICQHTDVNADPTDDGTGLCNAVSMGLGFVALPAHVGSTASPPDASSACDGSNTQCP